jgi:hypothetical protein
LEGLIHLGCWAGFEAVRRRLHRRFAALPFSTADAAVIEAGDLDNPYALLVKVIEAFNRDDVALANTLLAKLNCQFGCLPSKSKAEEMELVGSGLDMAGEVDAAG